MVEATQRQGFVSADNSTDFARRILRAAESCQDMLLRYTPNTCDAPIIFLSV